MTEWNRWETVDLDQGLSERQKAESQCQRITLKLGRGSQWCTIRIGPGSPAVSGVCNDLPPWIVNSIRMFALQRSGELSVKLKTVINYSRI